MKKMVLVGAVLLFVLNHRFGFEPAHIQNYIKSMLIFNPRNDLEALVFRTFAVFFVFYLGVACVPLYALWLDMKGAHWKDPINRKAYFTPRIICVPVSK